MDLLARCGGRRLDASRAPITTSTRVRVTNAKSMLEWEVALDVIIERFLSNYGNQLIRVVNEFLQIYNNTAI
jgi:hypothetical protein